MKYSIAVLFVLCCCSPVFQSSLDHSPELLEPTPLPPLPENFKNPQLTFDVKIRLAQDGSVADVEWGEMVVNREWDASAEVEIRKWKFTPVVVDGQAVTPWIQQKIRVILGARVMLVLGQITVTNAVTADSVFDVLVHGADFAELAREVSVDSFAVAGGYRGETDVRFLSPRIQEGLLLLQGSDITRPIRVGEKFLVFKRLWRKPGEF
jgi:hypothetical protein